MSTKVIKHKFLDHKICLKTEILIIGTFNPNSDGNEAEFFYGRSRNCFWKLLPEVFGEKSLKEQNVDAKKAFIKKYKINFIDLIEEIRVEDGQETNYDDIYICKRITKSREVIKEIENLKNLKKVFFTRKTFSNIEEIEELFDAVNKYCKENKGFEIEKLPTPSRFYNENKFKEWKEKFYL